MAAAIRSVYNLSLHIGAITIGKKQLVIEPVYYFCSGVPLEIGKEPSRRLMIMHDSHKQTSTAKTYLLIDWNESLQYKPIKCSLWKWRSDEVTNQIKISYA